ncbi:MAG: molybdenum cofactor biosynthesis protein B [Lysobacterales bacterium]
MQIAVLTVSDTRHVGNDTSGDYLVAALQDAGHQLHARAILADDRYLLRALISQWIADPACQVILTTGGTGFTGRDSTPEAIEPLLDKTMPGFGELFRALSFRDIGTSALQSRALAGLANGTVIVALPGSTGACQLAWEQILRLQLDDTTRPCNLAGLRSRFLER